MTSDADNVISDGTNALAIAAFAADAIADLAAALIEAGNLPRQVGWDISRRAEAAAAMADEDHGAQLLRIAQRLSSAGPRLNF